MRALYYSQPHAANLFVLFVQELFITTVMAFLRRKVPQLASPSTAKSGVLPVDDPSKAASAPLIQMPLLAETVQTILKCISASANSISVELAQEIFQMNLQARILLEKAAAAAAANTQQQQQQQQQQILGQVQSGGANKTPTSLANPTNNGGGSGSGTGASNNNGNNNPANATGANATTYDMVQLLNLNINSLNAAAAAGFSNSPSKLIMSQLNAAAAVNSSLNLAASAAAAVAGLNNPNALMAAAAAAGAGGVAGQMDANKINVLNSLLNSQSAAAAAARAVNQFPTNATRSSKFYQQHTLKLFYRSAW